MPGLQSIVSAWVKVNQGHGEYFGDASSVREAASPSSTRDAPPQVASLSGVNFEQRPSPSSSSLSTYNLSKGASLATGATGNSTMSPLQEQQRSLLHSQLATTMTRQQHPPLDHLSSSLPHHNSASMSNSRQRLRHPPSALSSSPFHHVSYHPKDNYRPVPPQMGAGAILGRRRSSLEKQREEERNVGDDIHYDNNRDNKTSSRNQSSNSSNNNHMNHDSQSSSSYRRDSNSSQRDNSSHDTPIIHRRDNQDNIHMLSRSISEYERKPRHNNNVHFSLNEKRHGFGVDNDDQSFGTNDSFRRDLNSIQRRETRRESKISHITDSSSDNNTDVPSQRSAAIPIPQTRNMFGKKIRKSHSRTDLVREMALDRNARRNKSSQDKLLEAEEKSNSPRRNSSFLSLANSNNGGEEDLDRSGGNRSTVGPLPESSVMDGVFPIQTGSSQSLQFMQSSGSAGNLSASTQNSLFLLQDTSGGPGASDLTASSLQQTSNLSTSMQQSYQFSQRSSAGSATNNSSANPMRYSSNLSTSLENSLQIQRGVSLGSAASNLSTSMHQSSLFQQDTSMGGAGSNLSSSMQQPSNFSASAQQRHSQFQQGASAGVTMNGFANSSKQHSPQLQGTTGITAPSGLSKNSSMQHSPQLQGAAAGIIAPVGLSNSSMHHSPHLSQLTTPTLGPSNMSLNSASGAPPTAPAQTPQGAPLSTPINRNQIMQPGWFPHHSEQEHLIRASHISRRFSAGSQSTLETGNLVSTHTTMESGDNTNILNRGEQQMAAALGENTGVSLDEMQGVATRQISTSNCGRCSQMEMTLLSLQADVEYLRTLELQREFLCMECQSSSRNVLKKQAKTRKKTAHLASKPQPPPIPENPSDGKSESSAVSVGSKASSRLPSSIHSSKLKRPSSGSVGGASRSSLRGSLHMGATRTAAFLRESSKRLADLSTRHKHQVKQTTHERAYWQNDMHLKLEKFAMMAKNLNEEAATRNNEVKETKAVLEKVTSERNGLISQLEMLKARVALYEEETVDYEKMREEWENVELQTLTDMENVRKKQDGIIRDLSMRLDLAVKTIETERRQQQQRRQIIFPASRQHSSSASGENSPSSPHQKAVAPTESLDTEQLEIIKATLQGTTKKYQLMLESSMAQSASREKELQDRVDALEKELRILKLQDSSRGTLPGSSSTASL